MEDNKNRIVLDIGIWDFEGISHDEITETIGVSPIKKHVKGERINPKFSPIAKKNGCIMTAPCSEYDSFKVQMEALLDLIELKKEAFRALTSKYYCEFSCALYIYTDNEESTPWVHLDSRYYEVTKELKIEFDIDIILLSNTQL